MITIETLAGTSVDVHEPTRSDFAYNLNGAFQYTLSHWIYKVLDIMGTGIGRFLGSALVEFLDIIKPELVDYVAPLLTDILENPELPQGLRTMLENIQGESGQAASTLLMGLGTTAGSAAIGSMMNSLMSPATYWINQQLRPARLGIQEAYSMKWRGLISDAQLHSHLGDQGWGGGMIDNFEKIVVPRFDISTFINMERRGLVEKESVIAELMRRGYTEYAAKLIFKSTEMIPSPGDLVSMAVREAFHPALIEKYQYMDNFPTEFGNWMEKMGYSKEWAEKYWVAHWRLPSINNGFEMLHRGEIDMDTMRDLLRTADIAPVWHEPLIQIAYHPYTRVDVRRMHDIDVLSDEELLQAYKDLGYDEEKAGKMAEFTIKYNQSTNRETTKGEILKGYRLGILSPEQARDSLIALDYPQATALYYLSLEDYRLTQDEIEEQLKYIKNLYISGVNSLSETIGLLGQLELNAERMERLLQSWRIEFTQKTKRPTKNELNTFVKQGIIEWIDYEFQLKKLHYPAYIISWYKKNLLAEMQAEANEVAEKQAKEVERLAVSAEATEYQRARAEVNYLLAIANVNLTECAYMIEAAETPEGFELYREQWWVYKKRIEGLKAQRAELTLEWRE